jgi:hypothetical protein
MDTPVLHPELAEFFRAKFAALTGSFVVPIPGRSRASLSMVEGKQWKKLQFACRKIYSEAYFGEQRAAWVPSNQDRMTIRRPDHSVAARCPERNLGDLMQCRIRHPESEVVEDGAQ